MHAVTHIGNLRIWASRSGRDKYGENRVFTSDPRCDRVPEVTGLNGEGIRVGGHSTRIRPGRKNTVPKSARSEPGLGHPGLGLVPHQSSSSQPKLAEGLRLNEFGRRQKRFFIVGVALAEEREVMQEVVEQDGGLRQIQFRIQDMCVSNVIDVARGRDRFARIGMV
jgi:hypothetical protein